jgi:hypothetical protein
MTTEVRIIAEHSHAVFIVEVDGNATPKVIPVDGEEYKGFVDKNMPHLLGPEFECNEVAKGIREMLKTT